MSAAPLFVYPVNDFGPIMKGLVIGGIGILHVFLAQFAIGGGMLMSRLEWLRSRGREPDAGKLLNGYFRWLVLVSFVVGVLTGVGMWFTTIQISPTTIGAMVGEFHWLWATEWAFFCLEVVSGYAFYRYGEHMTGSGRLTLLVLYTFAAWMSLFWINGILSWQLTPGAWPQTHRLWSGFFNPSFWPTLFFRTAAAMAIAALAACLVIGGMHGLEREPRRRLIHRCSEFLVPLATMPLLGIWFLAVIPRDSREWITGGSAAMTLFFTLAAGMSVLVGLYGVVGLWRRHAYISGSTAALLLALCFIATAGGEFVREGARKPYSIRQVLYSNSITPQRALELRQIGCTTGDPYPLRDADAYPTEQLRLGALTFRAQCGICHTWDGVNGLRHLAGTWTTEQKRQNIAKLQRTKGFMPPFAGTPQELEALVQTIEWHAAGSPASWHVIADPAVLSRIRAWMDEVGTTPAHVEGR